MASSQNGSRIRDTKTFADVAPAWGSYEGPDCSSRNRWCLLMVAFRMPVELQERLLVPSCQCPDCLSSVLRLTLRRS